MTIVTSTTIFEEIQDTLGLVPTWIEEVPEAALPSLWGMMRDFYLAETVIPNKYKELIGIAVAGATRCKYCVLFHTESARLFGATDEEIGEASYMGGFTMLASTFVNATQVDYERFRRETMDIVKYIKSQHHDGDHGRQAHV